MENKIILGLSALALVAILAVGALAFGFGGKGGPNWANSTVQDAIATGDYSAYAAAVAAQSARHLPKAMTEEQFNQASADYQAQKPIMDAKAKAGQAIKDNSYADWSSAMNSLLDAQKAQITQANFNRLVQEENDWQNRTVPNGMMGRGWGMHAGRN